MRHHGACPCTANTVRRRGGAANDCSPLLTWTPELCTVSGVAQFDTMSDAAKAALATQLADPEAASAFLSTASFVVSVESIEVEPTVGPPPATSSGGDSGSKSVAAGVITLLVAAALVSWWRRRPPWRRPW